MVRCDFIDFRSFLTCALFFQDDVFKVVVMTNRTLQELIPDGLKKHQTCWHCED
jgi:hypothetical protein